MRCPFCKAKDSAVIDSRGSEDGYSIRRRRMCQTCGKRFTTFERVELNMPAVIKRTGARREYDREKIRASMRLALRKRPIENDRIEEAIDTIEQRIMTMGEREVQSSKIGELVLEALKGLDAVGYMRFASVYFNVDDPEGFSKLLKGLDEVKPQH